MLLFFDELALEKAIQYNQERLSFSSKSNKNSMRSLTVAQDTNYLISFSRSPITRPALEIWFRLEEEEKLCAIGFCTLTSDSKRRNAAGKIIKIQIHKNKNFKMTKMFLGWSLTLWRENGTTQTRSANNLGELGVTLLVIKTGGLLDTFYLK